jgi:serine/threonine protein kinase
VDPAFEPGATIDGFVLRSQLGRGAPSSILFAAEEVATGRPVALRVLGILDEGNHRHDLPFDPRHVSWCLHVVRTAGRLEHPGIARLIADGVGPRDRPYIVTELLHGEHLAQRVARDGRLVPGAAVQVALGVANALAAAHAAGVSHGALTAAEVHLVPDGPGANRVCVVDFGTRLFRHFPAVPSNLCGPGPTMARLAFMAPEFLLGREPDPRTDVYGLGAMLYQMLVGEPPFGGVGLQLAGQIVSAPFPSVRVARPDVGAELAHVIDRAVTRRAEDRCTLSELRDALQDER